MGQAIVDTLGQRAAKFSLGWILVVAVLGVTAPFLANSHPYLYRVKGSTLTSPLLAHLTPTDIILVLLTLAVGFVLWRRPTPRLSWLLCGFLVLAVGSMAALRAGIPRLLAMSLWRPESIATNEWFHGSPLLWRVVVVLHFLAAVAIVAPSVLTLWIGSQMVRSAVVEKRIPLMSAVLLLTTLSLAALFLKSTPTNIIYEQYRQAEQRGDVELVVRAPIPYSPNDRLRDRSIDEALRPPGSTYLMGTTQYREDMFSRMIHACRVALSIGLIATGISTLIGVVVGGVIGYFGGKLDLLGMRIIEILEAIPVMLVLLIITVSFGRSLYLMMVAIGVLTWTSDARFIRGEFFKLRRQDFVQAAVAAGLPRSSIIFRHMLPNGIAPVLVNASFGIAGAIILESTLSFLGMGLDAEDPSWGQLLMQARGGGGFNWWVGTFPGLAIFLTVFSYILIGESMRDALDPKLKKAH
jgi:peptide/nickel transport system permease protein